MAEWRILVVEDDDDQRRLLAELLAAEGHLVASASSVEAATTELARSPVDLVISDWRLAGRDGMSLLAEIRAEHPTTGFIMATAYGTISHAVEAVRAGADDYLPKPFERAALLLAVERTLRSRRLENENRRLAEEVGDRDRLVDLIGRSPSMQKVFRRVEKLAGTEATVLLGGESGTGKELAARALHQLSRRAGGPFVAVNCAAIPETLVEAEFFGAERGAYTGADRARAGKFEAAQGGTLFLDEVGELPQAIQPKLLRALQERRITRVGATRELDVDARVIAATNRDLAAEVAAGRFREDLYYRLNVVAVTMPPLRERREDVPLLAEHFRERFARRHGTRVEPFSTAVLRRLVEYPWPGNARELANAVERLVLLAEDGVVSPADLPAELAAPARTSGGFRLPPGGLSFEELERDLLAQALELAAGNRARAARLLDLPYKAFLYRLEKFGL
ncbi:MAG: sigma-54 dependent transcriptional regulator [Thermoanaerobaculia bacterium]|nr:sigma-54 dependent transcriptional regulator [Thermoanaerobaculia bacterium]